MLKVWPTEVNAKSDVEYIMNEMHLTAPQRIAVLSKRRDSDTVQKREYIQAELRKLGYSLPEIGRAMGRHHTSVLNLLRRHLAREGRQGQCEYLLGISRCGQEQASAWPSKRKIDGV